MNKYELQNIIKLLKKEIVKIDNEKYMKSNKLQDRDPLKYSINKFFN